MNSNGLDRVFCFCCKLFKHKPMTISLAEVSTPAENPNLSFYLFS
jgi:hypothetical protein